MANMINLTIANNVKRVSDIVTDTTTLREAFESQGIDYAKGVCNIDGCILKPGDLDKTFADFGINDRCYLASVVKADNARA